MRPRISFFIYLFIFFFLLFLNSTATNREDRGAGGEIEMKIISIEIARESTTVPPVSPPWDNEKSQQLKTYYITSSICAAVFVSLAPFELEISALKLMFRDRCSVTS